MSPAWNRQRGVHGGRGGFTGPVSPEWNRQRRVHGGRGGIHRVRQLAALHRVATVYTVQYVWATWQLDCMATCCQAFEFLLPDNCNGTGDGNMFTGNRATFGNIFNGNKKRNIEEICPIKNVAMK